MAIIKTTNGKQEKCLHIHMNMWAKQGMKYKKRKGRNYRFGESSRPTSVSMPDTLRRIAKEHADSRGVSLYDRKDRLV